MEHASPDQWKDLLARLERAEGRAKELDLAFAWQASRTPAASGLDPELGALQSQVDAHAEALSALREELSHARAHHARRLEVLQAELDEARRHLPALVEAARVEVAPQQQDHARRQIAFMQKRLREQFDAAVEEHVAARTRDLETQLSDSQGAVAELEKQAAANDAKLAALQTTMGDLTLAARAPEWKERDTPWYQTWRMPALAVAVIALALIAWQASKRLGGANAGAPVSEAALLDQAGEAAVRKDYARAESLYRDVLKKNPNQEEALRGLGNSLLLESESVLHALPPP